VSTAPSPVVRHLRKAAMTWLPMTSGHVLCTNLHDAGFSPWVARDRAESSRVNDVIANFGVAMISASVRLRPTSTSVRFEPHRPTPNPARDRFISTSNSFVDQHDLAFFASHARSEALHNVLTFKIR